MTSLVRGKVRMKSAAAVMALALAGCFSAVPQSEIGPGSVERWQGAILDAPLVIHTGGRLEATGLLDTPGPIVVRGTLVARFLTLLIHGSTPELRIEGGEVVFDQVMPRDRLSVLVADGGSLTWQNSTVAIARLVATSGASVHMSEGALIGDPSAGGSRRRVRS